MMDSLQYPYCNMDDFKKRIKEGVDELLYRANGSDKLAENLYSDIVVNMVMGCIQPNFNKIQAEINNNINTMLYRMDSSINTMNTTIANFERRIQSLETNYSTSSADFFLVKTQMEQALYNFKKEVKEILSQNNQKTT